jgi:hypothetical protein
MPTVNEVATSMGNAKNEAFTELQALLDGSLDGSLTTAEKTARLNQLQDILAFVKAAGQTAKEGNTYAQ